MLVAIEPMLNDSEKETNMKNTTSLQTKLSQGEIAQKAYEIWQTSGCPVGRDLEHWLQAERQLVAFGHQGDGRAENTVVKRRALSATGKHSNGQPVVIAGRNTFSKRGQTVGTR